MSVSLRTEYANDKFQQTGVDNNLVMRRLDNAFWNYRFDGLGNLGLSYTHYQRSAMPASQVFGISFSTLRSWWGSAVISAYQTEGSEKSYSIGLLWVIPTSRDLSASLLHSTNQDAAPVTVLQAQKSTPYGEGIGWRLQAAINAAQQASVSVYEALLCYNLLWKDTGGVKMALAGPGGDLMLLYELYVDQLMLNELQVVISNFSSISHVWSVYVTGESQDLVGNAPGPMDMLHLGA